VSGSSTAKNYVEGMRNFGFDSKFSILPAKVTVRDDKPMEIVTIENITSNEWMHKLYGNSNLENDLPVLKLLFNVPWYT
jgi:hypothetical protein